MLVVLQNAKESVLWITAPVVELWTLANPIQRCFMSVLVTALLVGFIGALAWKRYLTEPPRVGWTVYDRSFGAAITSLAFFCMVFPLAQLVLFYDSLSNGGIGLRIASILVAYKALDYTRLLKKESDVATSERESLAQTRGFLSSLWRGTKGHLNAWWEQSEERRSRWMGLVKKYLPSLAIDEGDLEKQTEQLQVLHRIRRRKTMYQIALIQYGIYLTVVTALLTPSTFTLSNDWAVIALGLLGWAFLFVVDDTAIITNYSRVLRGHMMRWHYYRIHGFNLILLLALLAVTSISVVSLSIPVVPLDVLLSLLTSDSSDLLFQLVGSQITVGIAIIALALFYMRYTTLGVRSSVTRSVFRWGWVLGGIIVVGSYTLIGVRVMLN